MTSKMMPVTTDNMTNILNATSATVHMQTVLHEIHRHSNSRKVINEFGI